jgi:chlorite dismutase
MYNDPSTSVKAKTAVLRVISYHFGSAQEFDDMEWVVVY